MLMILGLIFYHGAKQKMINKIKAWQHMKTSIFPNLFIPCTCLELFNNNHKETINLIKMRTAEKNKSMDSLYRSCTIVFQFSNSSSQIIGTFYSLAHTGNNWYHSSSSLDKLFLFECYLEDHVTERETLDPLLSLFGWHFV